MFQTWFELEHDRTNKNLSLRWAHVILLVLSAPAHLELASTVIPKYINL